MKVLIINYNRLTLPRNMAEWIADHGCDPVIIDNQSDYPPLLEYYRTCPFQIIRMPKNFGHKVIWEYPVLDLLGIYQRERFILTDPDLDLTGVPDDFVEVMNRGLDKYPGYDKCGLSLEINDLPDTAEGNFIRYGPEKPFWEKPLDDLYFDAITDTTFALYRKPLGKYSISGIRVNRPYTARHIPWYYDDLSKLPDDEKYYYRTAMISSCSHKKRLCAQ